MGLVKFACLLHDVGKPATKDWNGERFTYYGHDELSADMTDTICQRLKTGNDVKHYLKKLVRWHMFYYNVGEVSPAGVRRFLDRKKGK